MDFFARLSGSLGLGAAFLDSILVASTALSLTKNNLIDLC